MGEGLQTVLRLRRLARDQARSTLAVAWREQQAAEDARTAALDMLVREARAAPADASDALAGRFPAWLPRARALLADLDAAAARRAAEAASAHAALGARQADMRAAELLLGRRQEAVALKAGRRAQHVLDEAGSHPPAMAFNHDKE